MKNLEKFLEFNGKRITIISADGTWWIALKPVCEALGVDYEAQRKSIQSDAILSELPSEQTVVAGDNKVRKMLCLPEKFVYGWLFSIRSDSESLLAYKRKCYEVLFDHFHGALTARMTILTEQDTIALKILALEESLMETEQYREIQELKARRGQTTKELKKLDLELKSGQLAFSFS